MIKVRIILILGLVIIQEVASFDYGDALTKSMLYFETQRSGKLPPDQRVEWRGDSALDDGKDNGVNLVGGYYDAGDNVKFGFPMAFTVTMLSWSVIEFGQELESKDELSNALTAIRWGTDYFIKAHVEPNVLYAQVGDGDSDHSCWMRPEEMTTPRTSYKIDEAHPGSDCAGETAAALAAASIAFRKSDPNYSNELITHAQQLFEFAKSHQGKYSDSIPQAHFYSSNGFEDELAWAAAWIYRATKDKSTLDYLQAANNGGTRSAFSWDDKYSGAQLLVAQMILSGSLDASGNLGTFKTQGEQFLCDNMGKGNSNIRTTPGGGLYWMPQNDLQYTTSALFLASAYANSLKSTGASLQCNAGPISSNDIISFIKSQVDYILGNNPKGISYLVGYGPKYPLRVHHRGASIISIKKDKTPVTCQEGFNAWYYKEAPNPNVLEGAIVGGPNENDKYEDARTNYDQNEPATANTAPFVGVLALLASS